MKWVGKNGDYHWLVSHIEITDFVGKVLEHHEGQLLHITSFDSGPLTPTVNEVELGWYVKNGVVISPPINEKLDVPYDQYDEWYISECELVFPTDLEVFVNYSMFQLASSEELTNDDCKASDEIGQLIVIYFTQLNRKAQEQADVKETSIYSTEENGDITRASGESGCGVGIGNALRDYPFTDISMEETVV